MAREVRQGPLGFLVIALVFGVCGCGSSGGGGANVAGTYDHQLEFDGLDREFIVYVPASAEGAGPVPLVFMIHGTAQDGRHFYDESGWRAEADRGGFIVVFPTSLTYCFFEDDNKDGDFTDPGERRVTTKWANGLLADPDVFPLCGADDLAQLTAANRALADHPLADDVGFFDAMIAHLRDHYRVDPRRIYATGFSNGAAFTQRLLKERAQTYAAFAANAAPMGVDPAPADRAASLMFTIGNADPKCFGDLAPVPMDELLISDPSFEGHFITPLLTTMQLDDTYGFADRQVGATRVMSWTFETSQVGATNRLEFHLIEGLAHSYPDSMPTVLWTFFQEFSLR